MREISSKANDSVSKKSVTVSNINCNAVSTSNCDLMKPFSRCRGHISGLSFALRMNIRACLQTVGQYLQLFSVRESDVQLWWIHARGSLYCAFRWSGNVWRDTLYTVSSHYVAFALLPSSTAVQGSRLVGTFLTRHTVKLRASIGEQSASIAWCYFCANLVFKFKI
jgi:hypothetical protein